MLKKIWLRKVALVAGIQLLRKASRRSKLVPARTHLTNVFRLTYSSFVLRGGRHTAWRHQQVAHSGGGLSATAVLLDGWSSVRGFDKTFPILSSKIPNYCYLANLLFPHKKPIPWILCHNLKVGFLKIIRKRIEDKKIEILGLKGSKKRSNLWQKKKYMKPCRNIGDTNCYNCES